MSAVLLKERLKGTLWVTTDLEERHSQACALGSTILGNWGLKGL